MTIYRILIDVLRINADLSNQHSAIAKYFFLPNPSFSYIKSGPCLQGKPVSPNYLQRLGRVKPHRPNDLQSIFEVGQLSHRRPFDPIILQG